MKIFRAVLVVLTLSSLTVIDARPTAGEIYRPWCVEYQSGKGDGGTNCSFTSYEQCMMTATPGSGGFCVQNPWYLWYGPGGQKSDTTSRGGRTRR
jgi:Protein of unknown function (DUF3551)